MYGIIYILALCISYIVIYGYFRKNNTFMISKLKILLIALIFAFYSASLGYEMFPDRRTFHYQFTELIPNYYNTWSSIINSSIEPGFIVLNLAINWFTDNSFWLFFTITFIAIYIDLYVINKLADSNSKKVSMYYLLSLQFFFGTYLCRQIIAASLINLAFLFFMKNKKNVPIVFILLASSFHTTAIIMLPIYLFLYRKRGVYKKNTILFTFLLFVLIIFLFEPIVNIIFGNQTVNQYLGDLNYSELGGNFTIVLKGLPFHLIAIYSILERKKILNVMNNADIYIITAIINSMCWIMASQMYWIYRLALYGTIPSLILIPFLVQACGNKNRRAFYKYSIIGSMLLITVREIAITLY